MVNGHELRVCDCCRILDDDWQVKLCRFCEFCQAWLCDRCRRDPWRRARAAMAAVYV